MTGRSQTLSRWGGRGKDDRKQITLAPFGSHKLSTTPVLGLLCCEQDPQKCRPAALNCRHFEFSNLSLVVQVLGSPTEETWPGISRSEELINYKFPHYNAESLISRAPRLDPDGKSNFHGEIMGWSKWRSSLNKWTEAAGGRGGGSLFQYKSSMKNLRFGFLLLISACCWNTVSSQNSYSRQQIMPFLNVVVSLAHILPQESASWPPSWSTRPGGGSLPERPWGRPTSPPSGPPSKTFKTVSLSCFL